MGELHHIDLAEQKVRITYPMGLLLDGGSPWVNADAFGSHPLRARGYCRLWASNRATAVRAAVAIRTGWPYRLPSDLGEVWA